MGHNLLADIGIAIIAAAFIGLPAYLLGLPLILAYITAGVVLGPHMGLGIIGGAESIATLSEIGLVLLMFILGLEINLSKLLRSGRVVTATGIVQIGGALILGLLFFSMAGYNNKLNLVYLAVACSLSSTLIVVKILSDQMDLDTLPSRITLGVLVLQDLFAIGFLAVQPNLANLQLLALATSAGKVAILVTISWGLAKFALPRIFKSTGRQPELMLITAMGWCFGMCGVANYLNLSLEMGALVAGVSIASFPYHLDLAAKISSLRDFFITLFFVSLGLQIPIPTFEVIKLAAFIIAFVMLSRVITIFPLLHKLGYANRASLIPAINLSQVSEFSLILTSLGLASQHIDSTLVSAFVIALVITALLSSFLIPTAHTVYKTLNPILELIGFKDHISNAVASDLDHQPQQNINIALLGFYREASSLLYAMEELYSKELLDRILVVDFNPEAHAELKRRGIKCHYGDISNLDTLRQLEIANAQMIACTIPDKVLKGTTNMKLLKTLRQLAPDSCIVVTSENISDARELYLAGASYVFIPRIISTTYLIDVIEKLQKSGRDSIKNEALAFLQDRAEVLP